MKNLIGKVFNRLKGTVYSRASFAKLAKQDHIYLYAGDVPPITNYKNFIGLSLTQSNWQHIKHDVSQALLLGDNCVDIYQSEDVFEHIVPTELPAIINEIYRVLKPGGVFRLSLPDYRCDLLRERTRKDKGGNLLEVII